MLAYRVREHNETDQTIKKQIINTTNGVVAFKNRSTRNNVLSVFLVAAPRSRSVYTGPISTINLSGPHNKYPALISMYMYPHKRNADALPKVGVIIKVVVFRTLCCVVARIALATDCCCFWSIRSSPRCERGWMLSGTSEKRARKCILNGTPQLFSGS